MSHYKDKATSLYKHRATANNNLESSTNLTFNENYVLGLNFVMIVRSNSIIALTGIKIPLNQSQINSLQFFNGEFYDKNSLSAGGGGARIAFLRVYMAFILNA